MINQEVFGEVVRKEDYESLRTRALASIRDHRKAINFSVVNHIIISMILREFCYDESLKGSYLPVVYKDNAEPFLFPLGRLSTGREIPPKSEREVFTAGTVSQRHYEMDFLSDQYIVMNSSASSRGVPHMERQKRSYRMALRTLRQMDELLLWVELLHTGLQPALIGILLAVEEILFEHHTQKEPSFIIESFVSKRPPKVIVEDEEEENELPRLVTRDSFGAKIEDYLSLLIWA